MKKKLKLKKFVMPSVYVLLVSLLAISTFMSFANGSKEDEKVENITYVSNIVWTNDTPVVSTDKVIIKPFTNTDVAIGKYYYDYKENQDSQKNAIIYYEDSYIQNSGVDYILDKTFDVISIYDGTVTKVENNDVVGKTVEIKHENNIISVYQSLKDVTVNKGDKVTAGQVIGKSGSCDLITDSQNNLHFELYVNGTIADPEIYYNKKLSDF